MKKYKESRTFEGTMNNPPLYFPAVSSGAGYADDTPLLYIAETGEPYGFDPWNAVGRGELSSRVFMLLGQKNHGKTAFNKILAWRLWLRRMEVHRLKMMAEDHRLNKGVGEYQPLCNITGTESVLLSKFRLNMLEMSLNFTFPEQLQSVRSKLEFGMNSSFSPDDDEVLRNALHMVRTRFPVTAELGHLMLMVNRMTVDDVKMRGIELLNELAERNQHDESFKVLFDAYDPSPDRLRFEKAKRRVQQSIGKFMDGEFGGIFGGNHSIASAMQQSVFVPNYVGLSDPAVRLVQSWFWEIKNSAIARGDTSMYFDLEFHDENYKMWKYIEYARNQALFLKQIRSTRTTVFIDAHRLKDYEGVGSSDTEQYKLANNHLSDVDGWFLGLHTESASHDTARFLDLTETERKLLRGIHTGTFLYKPRDGTAVLVQLRPTPQEMALISSNGANDGVYIPQRGEK